MDNLIKHWGSHPRFFPSQAPIQSIGFTEKKPDGWIRTSFTTVNFSIILRGGGELKMHGRKWKVEAPCVLMQYPGTFSEYGPSEPHNFWDELYLIYHADALPIFQQMRMVDLNRPVWPIQSADWLENRLMKINSQLGRRSQHGLADWLDRALQQLILDALLALAPPEMSPEEKIISKARRWVQQNLDQTIDWEALASEQGMSLPTFRRHWNESVKTPPAAYLNQIRIREARSLLVESAFSVGEIASMVGVEDPLYFSRLFRKETGSSPTDYRETFRYRSSLSG